MKVEFEFNTRDFNKYRVDQPYPEVAVERPNRRWAAIVSGGYAGKGSEMTGITQYFSHRFFLDGYPEIRTAYTYIMAVESIHLDLLGNLVKNLGAKPKFLSYETNTYWNGSFPAYRYTPLQIFLADLEGERDAIAHYKRMIALIPNEGMRALFRRIIQDEERHVEILEEFIARFKAV